MKIGTIAFCLLLTVSGVWGVDNLPTATVGTRNGDVCIFSGTTSTLVINASTSIGSIKLDNAVNAKNYSVYTNRYNNGSLTSESLLWQHKAETSNLNQCDQLGSVNVPSGGFNVYQESTATLFIYLRSN